MREPRLSDVNLLDLDTFERGVPHDWFELLRREAPVFWHDEPNGPGFWNITKHADLKSISRNPTVFSSARRGALLKDPESDAMLEINRKIMLNMDPPQHRQYRNLVNKAFTPRMIANLHGRIRELVVEIVDGVIERGECDFVEDVAAKLPMLAICEMMGVPDEDRMRIYTLGNQMVGFDDPDLQPDGVVMDDAKSTEAFAEMFMYASKLRNRSLAEPRDDLATGLVHAELDGQKLTEEDFQFFFLLLLLAGNETTRTVTTNGMLTLIHHPDQLRDLRNDPSLINSAIEEILRFAPAVHNFRRQVLAPTEIRGQKLEENDKVILWYPSANRDEEVFRNPHTFDIRRSPNDHLAFGIGEHFCLGANLARLELQEIFRGITSRMHDIELTAQPRRLRSNFINGVKEMRISFRPAHTLGRAPADQAARAAG
jgi:cholest-4-en-3-one 26-monooxygenase